jgi:hypothetical protein
MLSIYMRHKQIQMMVTGMSHDAVRYKFADVSKESSAFSIRVEK